MTELKIGAHEQRLKEEAEKQGQKIEAPEPAPRSKGERYQDFVDNLHPADHAVTSDGGAKPNVNQELDEAMRDQPHRPADPDKNATKPQPNQRKGKR